MKKYMLFDGNFDFDKFCDAVNSMKNERRCIRRKPNRILS